MDKGKDWEKIDDIEPDRWMITLSVILDEDGDTGGPKGGEHFGAKKSFNKPVITGEGTSPKIWTHTEVRAIAKDLKKNWNEKEK